MALFDPTKHINANKKKVADNNLPAGEYLIAGNYMLAKVSQKGEDYARIKYEVISGETKGTCFWSFFPMTFDKDTTLTKLALYCKAIQYTEPFETDQLSILSSVLLGHPFKANVIRKRYNHRNQNEIQQYRFPEEHTKEESAIIEDWILRSGTYGTEYRDDRYENINPPPPDDEDYYQGTPAGSYNY